MRELLQVVLVREEGKSLEPYRDSLGYWTIGIGHLIDRRKGGTLPRWIAPSFPITEEECQNLFVEDCAGKEGMLMSLPEWDSLDGVRKVVLLAMAFQLGPMGVLKFKKMLAAMRAKDWETAAAEVLDSDLAEQTPDRAKRLSRAMATGDAAAFDLE